ncbi:mevalonate kinase Erg12 [Schizosaccharomyces japonicus yFS275]|uniref:Mevalonate kinase n=1 Tax=Schizosaccharomyces japonicus (strain yFS275 / FY16936) TaxID=402676 RepID=B6K7Z2_SCHJY|nr:mevalonate kinase Erg12 [Schizosaccharomyces japonicus yFS275]EEB09646.1 mevalonate kinase Erg12 [Schizosaccharomyces japonicus yFS275]
MTITSAPGKLILFGEHAVVYGAQAVAAAVSLRTYCFTEHVSEPILKVTLADAHTTASWSLADLPWSLVPKIDVNKAPKSLDQKLVKGVHSLLECYVTNPLIHSAFFCILYMYMFLGSSSEGTAIVIRSNVPLGAGLGSSATVSVSVASALLLNKGVLSFPSNPSSKDSNSPTQAASTTVDGHTASQTSQCTSPGPSDSGRLIEAWSFVGECCIHGNPSGIDNAVATHGGVVTFTKSTSSQPSRMQVLQGVTSLPIMITDTKQPKSTKQLVQNVAKLVQDMPAPMRALMATIDSVSKSAVELLCSRQLAREQLLPKIGQLVELNQKLLECLHVSHPTLERVIDAAKRIGWTKLTGAGGGGCAYTVLRGADIEDDVNEVIEQLRSLGNETYAVELGGPGAAVWVAPIDEKTSTQTDAFFTRIQQSDQSWAYWS